MSMIGIITAMKVEAELLLSNLVDKSVHCFCGIEYYKGVLEGRSAVISICSVGKVNAALCTQIMIDRFDPVIILHSGIAGSLSDSVKHLDVVIATGLTYYDVRKRQLLNFFPNTDVFPCDDMLIGKIKTAALSITRSVHTGLIVTGDDFIAEKEKKEVLFRSYNALCVEMEGCAVAHAALINKVPCAVIRSISDMADGAATEDYMAFENAAAKIASSIILKTIPML